MGYSVYEGKTNSTYTRTGEIKHAASLLYDIGGNRKYLTQSERTAFLAAASRMPPAVHTFCLTLAYTGARISEVLALTPRRFDAAARVIMIESLKKRRRGIFRPVPIPAELIEELDRVHQIEIARQQPDRADEHLWDWCRTTAWHTVKMCMEEAGVDGTPASPKGLRHSFGVGALQAGVPITLVRKWLGHSRLSTTAIYADAVGEEEQEIAQRFWARF